MSIQLPVVNAAANDTWQALVDKLNGVINTVANSVVTANTNANGATTTGNVFIIGTAGATVLVANTLRGGNVQSSANLTVSSNALFTGDIIKLGANVVVNTSALALGANIVLSDSQAKFGNSTANAIINSTAVAVGLAILTSTALSLGNSTVNAVVNTSGVSISGAALPLANNKAAVAVNGALIGTATRINFIPGGSASLAATVDVANSQVNVIITSSLTLANGAGGANTNVLFNNSQQIGGTGGFTFDQTTNNAVIANTLTVGTTVVNSSIHFMGNSTINTVMTPTTFTVSNSTITTAYSIGGWNVGANVTANTTAVVVGSSVINTGSVSTGNVIFTGSLLGGNVVISSAGISLGNSTVNAIINSTALALGSMVANGTTITIGANLTINATSFLIGNSTVAWSGNSTQVQTANSTIAATLTPGGLAVGANVIIGFANVTVGATIVNNSGISAAAFIGAGIATAAQYWANTAGKVITSDVLNQSGAYTTLTDAASIVWDMSTGINFAVTLGGNRTLANPSAVVVGRSGILKVVQDGTGTRTLSYGANYVFDSDVAPVISTTASKENYLFWHAVTATRILITLAAKGV